MLLSVLGLLLTGQTTFAQMAVAVVTDPDGVNLRGGPGTEFQVLQVVPKGTELQLLGEKFNQHWIPTSYKGVLGFVHDDFVEMRMGSTPTPAPVSPPVVLNAPAPTIVTAPQAGMPAPPATLKVLPADGLNLRSGPSTDQRTLTLIPQNTRVTVTARSADGKWGQVEYNGQTGWLSMEYLGPLDAPTPAPAAPNLGSGKYVWPVTGRSITTYYGGGHAGIDIDQYPSGGNPVYASAAGEVVFAGGNPCCSYGLHVKVEHADGSMTLYAHLDSIEVRVGQAVQQAQALGKSGNTGFSTGAHLHYEIHVGGRTVDPLSLLPPR